MVHCNFVKGNHPCSAELTSQLECLAKVIHYSICFKVLKCQHLQTTSLTARVGGGGRGWGEGKFRNGDSTGLPPMWPRFTSRRGHHLWVEFVVVSLPCLERFIFHPSTLVFPSPKKPHFEIPIDLERTETNKVLRTPQCFGVKKKITF